MIIGSSILTVNFSANQFTLISPSNFEVNQVLVSVIFFVSIETFNFLVFAGSKNKITDTIWVNWSDLIYLCFFQVVMTTLLYTVARRCYGLPSLIGILGGLITKALEKHP